VGLLIFAARELIAGLYTTDASVAATAAALLAWLALFHLFDAVQTIAAFVLRAWHIATVPMLIYVASLWLLGLGGGYVLAFDLLGGTPQTFVGASGYWAAATAGLALAAFMLTGFLVWFMRQMRTE
jgi:MATE family multidrug resistance protein